jgi:NADPH:quinone reductase-like Zn-dependent oxidoreductase
MKQTGQKMRAAVIDRFGGADELVVQEIPVPEIAPGEVLIRVEYAGVGVWDVFEREGGYARMLGIEARFPYVLGSEGAGSIAGVGEKVSRFRVGDRVYAPGFLNPKGGFYAEFVAVDADYVSFVPASLTTEEASVLPGAGITALRGLVDVLELKPGESVAVFGASGGVGHVAVQLAKQMGARVFAIASGRDGVAMVKGLGIDCVIDGRRDDVPSAVRSYGLNDLDAALLTAGGEAAERVVSSIRGGGRVAFPNGIYPEPAPRPDVRIDGYNGEPEPEIIRRLGFLVDSGAIKPHIDRMFPLERAADAHRYIEGHHSGKVALRVI